MGSEKAFCLGQLTPLVVRRTPSNDCVTLNDGIHWRGKGKSLALSSPPPLPPKIYLEEFWQSYYIQRYRSDNPTPHGQRIIQVCGGDQS